LDGCRRPGIGRGGPRASGWMSSGSVP
jgi:hypothetical protein